MIAHLLRRTNLDSFRHTTSLLLRSFWTPAGALALACAAAFLCGRYLHANACALAFGLLAVLLLGFAWPWASLRFLTGTLRFDRLRVREGESAGVRVDVRNRFPWALWGVAIKDGFAAAEPLAPSRVAVAGVPVLGGRRTVVQRWTFVPPVRGVYPLAPPALACGFPFGLYEARRRLAVEAPLLVWPRSFPVPPLPGPSGEPTPEGAVSRGKPGSLGDVLGVRPYRRGDSPRRVHWRQTAKHDRLVVCELQSNARPLVQVVLDANPAVHAGRGPDGSREWAVRVAAGLCETWLDQGAEIEAAFHGTFFPADAGAAHRRKLLDALARLPDASGPALGDTLASPACLRFTAGLRVVVTTDRALAALPARLCAPDVARFIVLHADAFAGPASPGGRATRFHAFASLPVRPWIWLDDPTRLPAQVLHPRQEALDES